MTFDDRDLYVDTNPLVCVRTQPYHKTNQNTSKRDVQCTLSW